ncbi:unnamed protein product [Darwinula stevensoni]|uniref:Uncharacterized protein n=1 Tax=Darwinula stevensoni TaxID=69355 RepID=A0A7R9ACF0_9CRUS|nr:unnamed protein product [Darwinula stevensoni]CAG0900261.1 unnamed protein product [Darwinula stevensoni]
MFCFERWRGVLQDLQEESVDEDHLSALACPYFKKEGWPNRDPKTLLAAHPDQETREAEREREEVLAADVVHPIWGEGSCAHQCGDRCAARCVGNCLVSMCSTYDDLGSESLGDLAPFGLGFADTCHNPATTLPRPCHNPFGTRKHCPVVSEHVSSV